MTNAFFFVPQTHGPSEKRARELNYAAAKAHVAKRAHAKRRNLKNNSGLAQEKPVSQVPIDEGSETTDEDAWNGTTTSAAHTSSHSTSYEQNTPRCTVTRPVRNCSNDPFLPLVMDYVPQLNHAMDFVQFNIGKSWSASFMLRTLNRNSSRSTLVAKNTSGSLIPSWLWNLWITDGGSYMSSIIAAVPLLIRVTPTNEQVPLKKMALQLKQGSFKALRNGLRNLETSDDSLLILAFYVKAMFREACLTRDIDAAQWHAQMLEGLITRLTSCSPDKRYLFRLAYWSDAVPALFQMRQPVVKYASWMPQVVTALWEEADSIMPDTSNVNTKLPACVLSDVSQAAILQIRKSMFISDEIATGKLSYSLENVELLLLWIATTADHYICQLLEFYHKLIDQNIDVDLSAGERCMETSIVLALLHVLQKSFGDLLSPDGIDLHESAISILPALQVTITKARALCSRSERLFYRDAELWILFVSAHAEERLWREKPLFVGNEKPEQDPDAWFHNELYTLARTAGLETWNEARGNYQQFVFNPNLEPDPQNWYNETMATSRASEISDRCNG